MRTKQLYVITAIMTFLTTPLVFLSGGGGIVDSPVPGLLLHTITPVLEIFVLVVISVKIMPHHKRGALLLKGIAVLIALRALPDLLMELRGDSVLSTIFWFGFLILVIILISLFAMYAILLSHLLKNSDPALKLLNLYCVLRICGWGLTYQIAAYGASGLALVISMHFVALFHLAAQIALGIMLLRCASRLHTPEVGNQDENMEMPLVNHG